MASVSPSWYYQDRGLRKRVSVDGVITNNLKISFAGSFPSSLLKFKVVGATPMKKIPLLPCIKCEKKDMENSVTNVSVENYPYHCYLDSTSGQLEPASGARTSIPAKEYWPEGTVNQVRAARAPEPTAVSTGKPSFGKNPGSRRKKYKSSASASSSHSASTSESSEMNVVLDDQVEAESQESSSDDPKDGSSEYVVYQTESEEELSGYELDKKIGNSHPFIDPKARKPIEEPLTSEELWWNWRKPENEKWSRWQRRRPDVETVFLKAMAETGQIKLHGDEPTLTECALYRARRHIYKEERLQAEQERHERIGSMAYYSEWVSAWKRDTSREAVQKHFEETGEDAITQLMEMFSHQTEQEFRIMMGTDVRIRRDPLAMRMREDQIKQIWGGDPVYPTVNYIQDPDEVIDFRGPDFHEPTPDMIDYLKEHGMMVTKEEMDKILAKEKKKIKKVNITDTDRAMAEAVDIGEIDQDEEEDGEAEGKDSKAKGEDSEVEGEDGEAEGDDEEDKKSTPSWSSIRGSRTPTRKSKASKMSPEEATSDSENLTDFILDFEDY